MSKTALTTMTNKLAQRLDIGADGSSLIETLKATAFRGQVSDAQMVALLVVANQYALNPWTKEIYAFPDSRNGIIPVVGVDGWSRIINSSDNFDGMDFDQDDEKCTCIIYRKDRTHPIKVTEYMAECKRDGQTPWKSHPKRMLRHKAMIQCARIAFGYVGIYDPDEAERIAEASVPEPQKPQVRRSPASADAVIDGVATTVDEQGGDDDQQGAADSGEVAVINDSQLRLLTKKLESSGRTAAEYCEALGVKSLAETPFSKVNEALEWFKK